MIPGCTKSIIEARALLSQSRNVDIQRHKTLRTQLSDLSLPPCLQTRAVPNASSVRLFGTLLLVRQPIESFWGLYDWMVPTLGLVVYVHDLEWQTVLPPVLVEKYLNN